RLFEHDAVGLEDGIDVAGRPAGVVGECHGGAAKDVDICDDAAALETIAQPLESVLNRGPIEQRVRYGHATSSSCGATYTPRRRNAAGAWTSASTRAAGVLNGNHSRCSERDCAHCGAPWPSRAARCSASAA